VPVCFYSLLKSIKLKCVGTDRYLYRTASGVECHFDNPPAQTTATSEASYQVSKTEQNVESQGQSNPCIALDRSWGLQEFDAPQISRQSAREGGKVVSPKHRPPLPHMNYSWYSYLLLAESTPRPKGGRICRWKIPIKPETFRLVGQCLNRQSHHVPLNIEGFEWPAMCVNRCVLDLTVGLDARKFKIILKF